MRIETSYDPHWRYWLAEIIDDAGDFVGYATASTEQGAIDQASAMIAAEQSPEFVAPAVEELEY